LVSRHVANGKHADVRALALSEPHYNAIGDSLHRSRDGCGRLLPVSRQLFSGFGYFYYISFPTKIVSAV
jgi:hypothetical protein